MRRYRVTEVRLRAGHRWAELQLEPDTALGVDTPGARPGGGQWRVGPISGLPPEVADRARYEVEVSTADNRWCGVAMVSRSVGDRGELLGYSPLDAC